jgi:hypothetical protein
VLVNLDISNEPQNCLHDVDLSGVYIIGDIDLPAGAEDQLIAQGAVIIKPKLDLPFLIRTLHC